MLATYTPDPPPAGTLAYTFVKPDAPAGSELCSVNFAGSTIPISPASVSKIKFSPVILLLIVFPLTRTFPYSKFVAVACSTSVPSISTNNLLVPTPSSKISALLLPSLILSTTAPPPDTCVST